MLRPYSRARLAEQMLLFGAGVAVLSAGSAVDAVSTAETADFSIVDSFASEAVGTGGVSVTNSATAEAGGSRLVRNQTPPAMPDTTTQAITKRPRMIAHCLMADPFLRAFWQADMTRCFQAAVIFRRVARPGPAGNHKP